MLYAINRSGTEAIISLEGRLTYKDADSFSRMLAEALLAEMNGKVTFDLAGLEYLDSTGLGMLLVADADLRKQGARLKLAAASGQVARLLQKTRMDEVIGISLPH
jgi:HptB-dependent secretion and biofilm anti anti-sigma factor